MIYKFGMILIISILSLDRAYPDTDRLDCQGDCKWYGAYEPCYFETCDISEKAQRTDACEKRHQARVDALQADINGYTGKLQPLGAEIDELRRKIDAAEGPVTALYKEIGALRNELNKVSSANSAARVRLTSIKGLQRIIPFFKRKELYDAESEIKTVIPAIRNAILSQSSNEDKSKDYWLEIARALNSPKSQTEIAAWGMVADILTGAVLNVRLGYEDAFWEAFRLGNITDEKLFSALKDGLDRYYDQTARADIKLTELNSSFTDAQALALARIEELNAQIKQKESNPIFDERYRNIIRHDQLVEEYNSILSGAYLKEKQDNLNYHAAMVRYRCTGMWFLNNEPYDDHDAPGDTW